MKFPQLNPYVYFATRYPFASGHESNSRICYSSSLYLISEGKGTITTEGKSLCTEPGDLVYIPAGQKHDWVADKQDPMVHICCYFDWAYVARDLYFPHPHTICFRENEYRPECVGPQFPYLIPEYTHVDKLWLWVEMFEKFYISNDYTHEKTFIRSLRVQQQFLSFIEFFLSHVMKDEHIPDPRISKLLEQIDHDLLMGNHLPLEAYYTRLRISRGYFFELFKQATGMSPLQYMNLFRINLTKEDLQFTNLSITEIAEKHHYSSIHYFSKLFHQLTGMTPGKFREASATKKPYD
jgi:AraC-like DNA-binding protein